MAGDTLLDLVTKSLRQNGSDLVERALDQILQQQSDNIRHGRCGEAYYQGLQARPVPALGRPVTLDRADGEEHDRRHQRGRQRGRGADLPPSNASTWMEKALEQV